MNSSFGDNKRKPGASSSSVTEARRLATLAQTWTFPSKQPRVVSGIQVASAMARGAGRLALLNAEQNGALQDPPTETFVVTGLLRSKNITAPNGFTIGASLFQYEEGEGEGEGEGQLVSRKDMYDDKFDVRFTPTEYPELFTGMAELKDENIVAGDKSEEDRLNASCWADLGNDIFDDWGFFYIYDVESEKYYFPLISPQNQDDGVLTSQVCNAFGRTFTIVHGWSVQGIFKFDISVNDDKPFRFGAYGNMGSDNEEVTEDLTYSYSLPGKDLTLYYRRDAEDDNDEEILYSYFIPKKVEENTEKTYVVNYDGDNMSMVSKVVTRGLIVYFAKTNDVKEWVVNDLEIS
jgi:hypothetical protein